MPMAKKSGSTVLGVRIGLKHKHVSYESCRMPKQTWKRVISAMELE